MPHKFAHIFYLIFFALDIDECLDSPCLNGGNCANTAGGYDCQCPLAFTGENCEVRKQHSDTGYKASQEFKKMQQKDDCKYDDCDKLGV